MPCDPILRVGTLSLCLSEYILVYTYVCFCVYVYTYTNTYTYIYIYIYVDINMHSLLCCIQAVLLTIGPAHLVAVMIIIAIIDAY